MADDDRTKLPLIDIASVVIAPVLVMLMVGSLVFFLIEVLQAGRFEGRLHYTFFFFVCASVLVARISIRDGSAKAAFYGVALGAACFVAMMAFVEYTTPLFKALGPVINVGLMLLVWWSAHKLTWDCTHLDESRKASGRGVLAAVGLDGTKATTAAEDDEEFDPDRSRQAGKKRTKRGEPAGTWWQRYQTFREWRKKRPHTPGTWVFYFSLAAIPLFALGQATIPAEDAARRSSTFWQMAVYVGSGLGLLVTTTLMGLRRYLEDRNASIPTAMTAAWLGLGGVLIAVFLTVGALLPRPHTETPVFSFQQAGKSDRKASKNAMVKDNSAGEGDGARGQRKEAGDGNTNAKGGKESNQGGGDRQSGGGNQQGGKQSGGQGNQQGEKGGDGNKGGDSAKNKGQPNKTDRNDPNRGQQDKQGDTEKSDQEGDRSDGDSKGDSGSTRSQQQSPPTSQVLDQISSAVKWVVWIIVAVAVVVGLIYFAVKYLSNFTGWAKGLLDWLRALFAKKPKVRGEQADEETVEEAVERPPPFAAFSNPFTDGTAKKRTTQELVEYTFAAFDAWAWDHDAGRPPDETPTEFVGRLAEEYPKLEKPGTDLANLYVRALFSTAELPKDAKPRLARLWAVLEGAAEPAEVG